MITNRQPHGSKRPAYMGLSESLCLILLLLGGVAYDKGNNNKKRVKSECDLTL